MDLSDYRRRVATSLEVRVPTPRDMPPDELDSGFGQLELGVQDSLGGSGVGQTERAVGAGEPGGAFAPSSQSSAILAVDAPLLLGELDVRAQPPPGVLRDELLVTVAVVAPRCGGFLAPATAATATRAESGSQLHARQRIQFDRPIGSYQPVKHHCPDRDLARKLALGLYLHACGIADHKPKRVPSAAHRLAACAGLAFFEVALSIVQLHGGSRYTWKRQARPFYRRAQADKLLPGTPTIQRSRLATLLEI